MSDQQRNVCFVISPIGDDDSAERKRADQLLKFVVKPVLEQEGYTVVRADTMHDPGTISKQIIEQLVTVPMVVADMSGHNPNVFYELAVRHASRLPVIHMIEKGETIPFDVAPQRAIFYQLDLEGAEAARSALRNMLIASSASSEPADSPLTNALDRLVLGQSGEAGQRETALLELVQDIQLRLINMQSANSIDDRTAASLTSSRHLLFIIEKMLQQLGKVTREAQAGDKRARLDIAEIYWQVRELIRYTEATGLLSTKDKVKLHHPSRWQNFDLATNYIEAAIADEEAQIDERGQP